jgi:hypothetical protein
MRRALVATATAALADWCGRSLRGRLDLSRAYMTKL